VTERPVVIGVGNPSRRDDGVGWVVATAVGRRLGETVDVRWSDGEPGRLLDTWADAGLVVIIDAMEGGGEAGAIQLLSPTELEQGRPNGHRGTHALGVAEALALGRTLGRVPQSLSIVGIEGHDHGFGDSLSAPVAAAVDPAVDLIIDLVHGVQPHASVPASGTSHRSQPARHPIDSDA
jgi:hydrogenase maturation protease